MFSYYKNIHFYQICFLVKQRNILFGQTNKIELTFIKIKTKKMNIENVRK